MGVALGCGVALPHVIGILGHDIAILPNGICGFGAFGINGYMNIGYIGAPVADVDAAITIDGIDSVFGTPFCWPVSLFT